MNTQPGFYTGYEDYSFDNGFNPVVTEFPNGNDPFTLSNSQALQTTLPAGPMNQSNYSASSTNYQTMSGPVSKKPRSTIDTDASFSPASIYSDNSNYSDTSYPTFTRPSVDLSSPYSSMRSGPATGQGNSSSQLSTITTSAEEASSDDNDDGNEEMSLARKREKHTQVEAQRRALEKAHFRELSSLISSRSDTKTNKLHHLDLLKIAAEQINEMNLRHKNDPLRPSNLTDSELNFLNIEASNSFLFVTTMEPGFFRIIHVTESIRRVLDVTIDQWHGQNFFSLVHPDDRQKVQTQFMSFNPQVGIRFHFECRLRKNDVDHYSPVIIDGITKRLDSTLRPVQGNVPGHLAFVAICHIPLVTKYSETNMMLHKNPQSLTFRCRCSPHDWKIFLVDRSVSTLPSLSFETYRQKSILDFVHQNDHIPLHQLLLRSTTANLNETLQCHFIDVTTHRFIPMTVEIKSFFNPAVHRADFIELTFQYQLPPAQEKPQPSIVDFFNDDSKEIERLLESEPTTSTMANPNSTAFPPSFFYPNEWAVKDEI